MPLELHEVVVARGGADLVQERGAHCRELQLRVGVGVGSVACVGECVRCVSEWWVHGKICGHAGSLNDCVDGQVLLELHESIVERGRSHGAGERAYVGLTASSFSYGEGRGARAR